MRKKSGGRALLLSADVQAYALALTLAFVTLLVAAAAIAGERDENVFGRLTGGLVRLGELVAEKIAFVAVVGAAIGLVLAIVFGLVVELGEVEGGEPWQRLPLLAVGLVLAGAAFGALGVVIGAIAREARAATLLAFLVALPIVLIGLVPSSIVPAAGGVSQAFPFAHAVDLFGAALSDADPAGTVLRRGGLARRADGGLRRAGTRPRAKIGDVSTFPTTRLRRLRRTPATRGLVQETRLDVAELVFPMFVCPGVGVHAPLEGLPGIARRSVDLTCDEAEELYGLGIRAVLLFGIPEEKDEVASGAYDEDGIVQRALRSLRDRVPELVLMTDVCLCEYTSHGHCGVVRDGEVLNDVSLELLARTAVSHAEAGAHVVAPSDMMDGRVGAIRSQLDGEGFENVAIVSYAAKYASAFYGPFREVADSAPAFGDRRSYQMDPPNVREAMRECALDVAEGADVLIVKPALPYLDVIAAARARFDLPIAAYNVSGEYAMVKAAAAAGWLDERRAALETLLAIKRAGADLIFTYWAKDVARWL